MGRCRTPRPLPRKASGMTSARGRQGRQGKCRTTQLLPGKAKSMRGLSDDRLLDRGGKGRQGRLFLLRPLEKAVEGKTNTRPCRPCRPSSQFEVERAADDFALTTPLSGALPPPGGVRSSPAPLPSLQSEAQDAQTRFYAERDTEGTLWRSNTVRVERALKSLRLLRDHRSKDTRATSTGGRKNANEAEAS